MATRLKFGTLFLNNSTGLGVAGGAATGEATTPWAIRNADWTPQAAVPLPIWGGGPPFTPGRALAYQSYDDVTERIPLLLDVSNHDDAANELQLLRQEIGLIAQQYPVLLEVKPSGSTNSMYTSVKAAWVQETPDMPILPLAGALRLRVSLTIVRSPFFGMVTSGETVINAQSIRNDYTGSPDNLVAYSAGSGDLIAEGSPLNLALTNATGSTLTNGVFFLGTVDSITSDASTQTVTTSSTTGVLSAGGDTITVGTVLDAKQATKMRAIVQCSSVSANSEMRIECYYSANAPAPFYVGPWFAPAANDARYDAGTVPSNLFKDTGITTMLVWLRVRSPLGGSITITISNIYIVYYYTLCRISGLTSIPNSTGVVHVRSFVATSNRPCLPLRRAEAYVLNSGNQTYYGRIDGTPPVYISSSQLWLEATTTTALGITAQFTATVTHGALWKTFRGAD